ncbi:MAG: transglycosylase SLT domain-containing protein [Anaerolineales bacterium]|nr:transglycosylase SLT domain-containing protein [Anaerolineales bacterium]MCX7608540.1 transglycosylase SLT domain-containing protein [Anaerolineales bacterium]
MKRSRIAIHSEQAVSEGGGFLSGFWLPPISVLVVGVVMFGLLGAFSVVESEESSASRSLMGGDSHTSRLSDIFTSEVEYWREDIVDWAEEVGLDPNLVATVMQIESCGNPHARSPAGAMGLFQVMPYHFGRGEDPYDPATNARRGLAYLARAQEKSAGDTFLTFAGYNGGLGVIGRSQTLWAQETRRYARWGSGIYADAVAGLRESPHLQQWLNAGGASLCRQAAEQLRRLP